jgi:hypothetical protein
MKPLDARAALDAYFLEARARILDLAAILDRIGRGGDSAASDPRLARAQAALRILLDGQPARAERAQEVFSLEYDPGWEKPAPRF